MSFAFLESRIDGLAPGQPCYRILVVDDHPANRLLLVKLLVRLGLEVQEAVDGHEAIARWQEWRPHLIWMDMRMPNLDGYEATRWIRALEREGGGDDGMMEAQHPLPPSDAPCLPASRSRTVIIGLTAQAASGDRTLVMEAGCDDYISKPFEAKLLFEKLEKHLGLLYTYAGPTAPPPQEPQASAPPLTAIDLSVMPDTWIAELHQAALHCHQKAITQLIQQIPETHAALAALLRSLSQNFAFNRIVTMTQVHVQS